MTKEGRRNFDAVAGNWDQEPRRVKLAQDIVEAIRREVPLTPEMVALDYGCGSGLVTLGLQPFVKRIFGADSSKGMLDVLRRKVLDAGISNVDTKLIDLEQQSRLDGSYDLIVSSMTMHHVDDVAALIASLAQSLNAGGWLVVADLETEPASFHDDATGVLHHGFEKEFFRSTLAQCGLVDVRVVTAATVEKTAASGEIQRYPVIAGMGRKEG